RDAVNIIKMAEINKSETFSLKWRISATELIPMFARVIPIAVTANNPAPWVISSTTVNVKMTSTNTDGDFKNSGICPTSNIQPVNQPLNHPNNIEKIAIMKNNIRAIPLGSSAVKYVIISKASTASNRSEERRVGNGCTS